MQLRLLNGRILTLMPALAKREEDEGLAESNIYYPEGMWAVPGGKVMHTNDIIAQCGALGIEVLP